MIRAEELTKNYGEFRALNQLSFEVSPGEVVGFLGPNGAGKSTTLRILTGFLTPTSGEAWIGGQSVSSPDESYRDRFGYLPEGAPLYPEMDVEEFLEFVAKVRKIPKAGRQDAIEWALQSCGLTEMRLRPIGNLSKGYRQRVGIAQAIVHRPDVLILDEPTSGLDPNQLAEILDLIRAYGEQRTVLFSSHILSEVQAVCSRVLILNQGQLIADDTPDRLSQLMSGHRYRLTIEGANAETAAALIRAESGVLRVGVQPTNSDEVTLSVELESDDLRSLVSRRVIGAGWALVEFKRVEAKLDEVFRDLTGEPQ